MQKMLKIIKVNNSANVKDEYVLLKVLSECDIGDFLLTDSTYDANDAPSNKLRHVFFFPSKVLEEGDYVVLWTKKGSYNLSKTTNGLPQHNLYWGLKETVWNIDGDKAFLFEAPRAQRAEFTVAANEQ